MVSSTRSWEESGNCTLDARTTIAFCTVERVTDLSLFKSSSAGIWRLQEIPKMVPGAREGLRR